jgi:hypothetical protein
MRKRVVISLIACFLFLSVSVVVQAHHFPTHYLPGDTSKTNTGFSFGLNMGAYFGNKYQANFYNGSSGNVDSINLFFGNRNYWEPVARNEFGTDTLRLLELPTDMHYQPAMQIGFYIKYNFSNNLGAFIQFNYCKLTAKDVFTLGIGPEPTYLTFDNIQAFPIWGKEERIYIDIGVSKTFETSKYVQLFIEGGLNINNTKVKEHKIQVGSQEYSLINIYGNQAYVPNTQLQTYETHLGGLGIGGFATGGLKFLFNNKISLDPGFSFYWTKANLEGYSAFRPQYTVFVRFCFQNLFSSSNN